MCMKIMVEGILCVYKMKSGLSVSRTGSRTTLTEVLPTWKSIILRMNSLFWQREGDSDYRSEGGFLAGLRLD